MFGELDESNPTALEVETLRALQSSGKKFTVLVVPGANHELVDVKTGEFNASWVVPVKAFIRSQ